MPNCKEHVAIGAAVDIGTSFLYCGWANRRIDSVKFLLAGAAGATVGLLPDVFEPAVSPDHRGLQLLRTVLITA